MMFVLASVLLATMAGAPADVSGKWEGKLIGEAPDGTSREEPALLILEQKDKTITGTAGADENDRHPITGGSIDGDKILLTVKTRSDRELKVELTVANDEMKGTILIGERKAQLQLKKRKE
jgi:hypothetical protein